LQVACGLTLLLQQSDSVHVWTLDELPKVKVESPSTIVIGDVAQFEFKRTKNSVTNNSQAGELV
jgi:hypothetical protein